MEIIALYRIPFIPDPQYKIQSKCLLVPRIRQYEYGHSVTALGNEMRALGVVRRLGGPAKPAPARPNLIPANYSSESYKPRGALTGTYFRPSQVQG